VDRLNVGLSGVHVDVVRGDDAIGGGVTRTPLMRAPASVDAVVWRVLSAGRSPGDSSKISSEGGDSSIDVPDLAVDADIAPLRLDLSAEDYRLLTTCFTDNTDERPAAIPKTTNPVDASRFRFASNQSSKFDRSLDRSQPFTRRTSTYATTKSAFTDTGAALLTLEEDHLDGTEDGGLAGLDGEGDEGEVDETNTLDRQTRPGLGAAAIRAACAARGFTPDGPTRVASRISIAASVVELSLFRGGGRNEPLASLAVRGTFLFIFIRAISMTDGVFCFVQLLQGYALRLAPWTAHRKQGRFTPPSRRWPSRTCATVPGASRCTVDTLKGVRTSRGIRTNNLRAPRPWVYRC